ncbi:ABC transporter ATP-binding protein [Paenibacillus lautus]|uniref:ABC transporter ATP-binding protein n=1 Tax=Paenibacillus lautus TaxID=1401 RepID=UPI002DBA9260|nr:ABC transporter ATP-binding protein [Paenibacillus lautus]MEC0310687.1 ABC transporter ATP-binding protein [Paenibacillus lautus]
MEPIIEVKNIVKKYRLYNKPIDRLKESLNPYKKKYHQEFNALNDVSFVVNKGDAVGILGKNGSGKSTLLKLITGVISPSSGEILVNGKVSAILELGAGFNPEYTGRENIYLNGLMMGYTREEMDEKINSIIDFADIGTFIEQPVKVYSSGMFARLAFAVSINVEPDILIVDEALAVGDIRFQTKCIEKMKELKSKGTTILFVSHATEQVKRFCNKAVWIKEGKVKAEGASSEIVDLYEDYMKHGNDYFGTANTNSTDVNKSYNESNEKNIVMPEDPNILASITNVNIFNEELKSFDQLEIEVIYEVYEDFIEDLLIGVALYTPKRDYIFGPNTHLEKIEIPKDFGRHSIKYIVPKLPLMGGTYCIDVGIFSNEGLICLNYKENANQFVVTNDYFSEGLVYLNHRWEVIK